MTTVLVMGGRQLPRLRPLNDAMEFDVVVRSFGDGESVQVTTMHGPELFDGELPPSAVDGGWRLMNGYSGQDSYSGPLMHQSEFIGGRMAHDILHTPGLYVALVNYLADDDDPTEWAVAWHEPIVITL